MADTLKELFASTITVSDIATNGSKTLLTTNATTKNVIKDVQVSGILMQGSSPALTINDFAVAGMATASSGTEIMDVNSTLKYRAFETAPVLTLQTIKAIVFDTSYQDLISTSYLINGTASSSSGATTALATDPTSAVSTSQYAKSNDGSLFYVYWDGNSVTNLYKRQGSVNGSQTSLISLSYGWIIFDGIDTYLYGQYQNPNLYKFNINTGVTTSLNTGFVLGETSYPNAALTNNGKLMVNYSGDGQTSSFYLIDPSTGAVTTISFGQSMSVSGNIYKMAGFYNATTNRYTFYKRMGGQLHKVSLTSAVTIGAGYGGGSAVSAYNIGNIGPANGIYNHAYTVCDSVNYFVGIHGVAGKTDLAVFNTDTSLFSVVPFLAYRTNSNSIMQNTAVPTAASNFTNSVKVRITGVEVT